MSIQQEKSLSLKRFITNLIIAYRETPIQSELRHTAFFAEDFWTDKIKIGLSTNLKVVAQDGAFFFNTFPDKPIEVVFKEGLMPIDNNYVTVSPKIFPSIECFDIK